MDVNTRPKPNNNKINCYIFLDFILILSVP